MKRPADVDKDELTQTEMDELFAVIDDSHEIIDRVHPKHLAALLYARKNSRNVTNVGRMLFAKYDFGSKTTALTIAKKLAGMYDAGTLSAEIMLWYNRLVAYGEKLGRKKTEKNLT